MMTIEHSESLIRLPRITNQPNELHNELAGEASASERICTEARPGGGGQFRAR
jgi:hypothetical protein